ncbi:MAG: DUF3667 domain-containing protein [Flavobacteriaceae bacterium]|nr:DUF3667 domain-containing protein [Flavobacteriaceae bacterium]
MDVFNGFFDFDGRFWSTFIPLLIKPGKVSRDYIDGKRQRYSNPFRFYLTVSILFFLIVGLYKTKQKYDELTKGTISEVVKEQKESTKKDSTNVTQNNKLTSEKIDSIKKEVNAKMEKSIIPIPKKTRDRILKEMDKKAKDSTFLKEINEDEKVKAFNINFGGPTTLDKYVQFISKHPDINIDDGLDSLGYEKNFKNRFLLTRAKTIYSLNKSKETRDQFFSQLLSYGSVALFLLLPIFTLFLKFFYIRRDFTYIDHLVFVFNSQTVFFLLLSIHFIFLIFGIIPEVWIPFALFAVYLFLSMRKFYQQGFIKTFLKFLLLNGSFAMLSSIGIGLLFVFSFMIF